MKKKFIYSIVMATILLLLMGAIISYSLVYKANHTLSEYEEEVNQITEIDYSKRQEELEQKIEDGMMNVQYSPYAVFYGKVSESFNIKNIKNNKYPIKFTISDENGNIIYKSNKIELGYELNNIELDKELSKGTHNCKIEIGYEEEGNVSSVFPITVEVR